MGDIMGGDNAINPAFLVEKKSPIAVEPVVRGEEVVKKDIGWSVYLTKGINPDVNIGEIFKFMGQSPGADTESAAASSPPPSPIKTPTGAAPDSFAAGMTCGRMDDAVYKPAKRRLGPASSFSLG